MQGACSFRVQPQELSSDEKEVFECSQNWWAFVRGGPSPNKKKAGKAAQVLKNVVDKMTTDAQELLQLLTANPSLDRIVHLEKFFRKCFQIFETTTKVSFQRTRQTQLLKLLDNLDQPLVFWLAQCPKGFSDQIDDDTFFGRSQKLIIKAYQATGHQSTEYLFSDGS